MNDGTFNLPTWSTRPKEVWRNKKVKQGLVGNLCLEVPGCHRYTSYLSGYPFHQRSHGALGDARGDVTPREFIPRALIRPRPLEAHLDVGHLSSRREGKQGRGEERRQEKKEKGGNRSRKV